MQMLSIKLLSYLINYTSRIKTYIYVYSTESYLKSPLKNSENTVDSNCFAAPYAYAIHDVKVYRENRHSRL